MKPEYSVTEELLHLFELALTIGKQLDPRENCQNFVQVLVPRYGLIEASIWWPDDSESGVQPLAALPRMHPDVITPSVVDTVYRLSQASEPGVLTADDPDYVDFTAGIAGREATCGVYPFADGGVLLMYSAQPDVINIRLLKSLRPIMEVLGTSIRGGFAREQLLLSEAELKKQRGFLKTLVNTIPDLVWLKDQDGIYLACNERFEQFFGAAEQQIIGKTDYEFVDSELADSFRMNDRRAMENNGPSVNEEWIPFASDGHCELLETTKTPMLDEEGTLVGVLGIGHDITQNREMQKQLEAERDRSQHYLDTVEAIIVSLDPEGRITMINRKGGELLGYAPEELEGKHWFEHCLVQPEGLELFWPSYQRMMTDGLCDFEYVENSIQTKTGQTRLIAWHNAFMQNPHGTVTGMLSAGEDITKRKQAEEDLKLAASVFVHANEGIIITDANAAIIDVNQAFTRITGYGRDEVVGKTPNLLASDQNGDTFHEEMWHLLRQHGQWTGEVWNRRKNGEAYAELLTISALYDDDGQVHRYLGLFSDITAQKQHQQQLEHSAHYDALTSLPNRILLADRLQQAMVQSHRHETLLAVAYLDLDGFKLVNDSFGHDIGDQLLVDLSDRFVHSLREGDTIARMGGDEFAIAMLDLVDEDSCRLVLARLLEIAAEPIVVNGHRLRVSASIGVTFYPQKEDVDADQLLRQADQAMYQAKQSGKNRYHVFDLEKDRSVRDQVDSLSRIESALNNNEFVLYYQPKVNMRTGQVVGVEALIRWNHPERGLLLPVNFLPLIENHELIIELGDWVLKDVLAQLERWQAQGIGLSVSINVNGYHLQQPDFFQNLCASLSACPAVDPSCLELEILETSALEDIAHVSHVIQDCREMGIHFALDDFGTGYSSLTYLKRLQTRMLKIDQSFVRDMLDDPDDLAILDGVLGLARSFRKQVIAEGVETLEHGEMLLMMGCELGQGYAIAHPMPADDMGDWLERWQPDPRWQQSSKARPEDEMIVHAIVEHRAWVTRLEKYIRGDRAEPPVLDPADCRFGCWLAGFEKEPGSDHAGVEHINLLHKEIHQLAEQVVQHKQGSSGDEADALLLTIRSLQRDLVVDLKQLILKSRVQFH